MIRNIVDKRTRGYQWKTVNAIIEDVWHDNSCADSDQWERSASQASIDYAQREGISLADAVDWAHQHPADVTLYLYDEGRGTGVVEPSQWMS